jgi:hypothetical protein
MGFVMIKSLKAFARFLRDKSRVLRIPYWSMIDLAFLARLFAVDRIPIIINSFNRLNSLLKLVAFLEKSGLKNIVILDNNSTYPPLLLYFDQCPYQVVRLKSNHGHLALWTSGLYRKYRWNYFAYTDPDVVPLEECPADFLSHFRSVLLHDKKVDKVGFGIKIDDIPDSFDLKARVIRHEQRHWEKEVLPNIFEAPIDTTFALYRPLSKLKSGNSFTLRARRCGFPYLVRHLPWYVDSRRLSEEDRYYAQTSNESSSIGEHQRGTGRIY